jgi:hypothetical protein
VEEFSILYTSDSASFQNGKKKRAHDFRLRGSTPLLSLLTTGAPANRKKESGGKAAIQDNPFRSVRLKTLNFGGIF